MKVNRESVVRGGLRMLNEVGLEQLTLRLLGRELGVQATAIYWHFANKQALLDAMATLLLAEGAPHLLPQKQSAEWDVWITAFGHGLRRALLAYRDGARMVAGTRLTDKEYMRTVERIGQRLVESGFTTRQAVVLLGTVYSYTLSFVQEEQVVYPSPGERSPQYDLQQRSEWLSREEFPLLRQAGPILLDRFDRRYKEGLELILRGAERTQ
ncbi:TetR/AcrR family transcriptional regulator C-terminal domain-containing protein [Terriglobus sp. ADX1]|uniref:TetR/AcrR family transcriptional regulator C-terminal domain-containing protein n=1 Tax=Terriglobus sp. ADX1 TaxID=2794063 RepID=UPI002FE4FBEA